tara:strand:+ start:334 stop:552 length:219 start_codon:yes stop_codon:yes gene_type:complete
MSKLNRKNKKLKKYTIRVCLEKSYEGDFYAEDKEEALEIANRSKESEWKYIEEKDDGNMLYKHEWEFVEEDL